MSINDLRSQFPDYAKDIKLNVSKVLEEEGAPGLSLVQIYSAALASAYATKEVVLINALKNDAATFLDDDSLKAAKAAASIMAMNNIYYRFVHLTSDNSYASMPANLRMNVIGNSGVDKVDFELMSLAVSAINGCGMCIDAHVRELEKAGLSKEGIQSAIRIGAVINAASQVVSIEAIS